MSNHNPLIPGPPAQGGNPPPPPQMGAQQMGGQQMGGQQMGQQMGGMNPMMMQQMGMSPMMMQQMAAMQQMQANQSQMNMGAHNNNNNNNNAAMNPMTMQQMHALQMQNMVRMQQMAAMQQQQQQQQQKQAQQAQQAQNNAAKAKKMAQIEPKAALSPKAIALREEQMKKMKEVMESQIQDLQRTGHSALDSDTYQIESILTLFGVNSGALEEIMGNFKKLNIKDADLKNLDLTDDKTLKKLIPNTKDTNNDEIRQRFKTWIRYDIKKLHIHENIGDDEKKQNVTDSVITLNISGMKYTTLKSTLLATGSTYFQRIFSEDAISNNKCIMDADNNYFIDRNGRLFEPILRYLQTKELRVKINEYYDINDIFEEMKYYDIQLPAQYDNKTDIRWLPNSFRFEYCCMYNQLQQFFASQFRLLPKLETTNIVKKIGALPKDSRDIEAFLEIKNKLIELGYELKDTQVFRGDPSQWVWTYVEFYQRIKW